MLALYTPTRGAILWRPLCLLRLVVAIVIIIISSSSSSSIVFVIVIVTLIVVVSITSVSIHATIIHLVHSTV